MRSVHRRKIDTCPVVKSKSYKSIDLPKDKTPDHLPLQEGMSKRQIDAIRERIAQIKIELLAAPEERKEALAKEGLTLATLLLSNSKNLKIIIPKNLQFLRRKNTVDRRKSLNPKFSELICTKHNTPYRIFIQKNRNHGGPVDKVYTYPVLVCQKCYNERKKELYHQRKINMLSALSGN